MNNIGDIIKFSKTLRLLYVEDNQAAREATLLIFHEIFGEIVVGVDGQDGVEKFNSNKIDIIITDINMPRLNGLEMTKEIRRVDKGIPILVLSAYNESGFFMNSIKLGVDGYLLKPIDMAQFIEALKKVIVKIKMTSEVNLLQQYQDVADISTIISKTDTTGKITYVNDAYCAVSQYKREELIGKSHNLLRHPSVAKETYKELWETIKKKKEIWQGVLKNRTKNGDTIYLETTIKPVLDMDGNILEYISIKNNITHTMNQKTRLIDICDASDDIILVLMKIENFDDIERYYGQNALRTFEEIFAKQFTEAIQQRLSFRDLFSLGDGEYAFVKKIQECPLTEGELKKELLAFQERVNESVVELGEIEYDVTILISLAHGKNSYENAHYGLKELLQSKKTFIIANNFIQNERELARKNFEILKMVKIALHNEKILVYSQAIIENSTQEVSKYESLVRLVDEDEKIISPCFFLDISKRGKYYYQITNRVLEQSFALLHVTDKEISINLSALDIERSKTREKIFELLHRHSDSAHRVVFELLEDEEMKDFELIKDFVAKVKDFGVQIAIDDFGAGFSNFERLLDYQPDVLKLDACLIKNIVTHEYSQNIVETIVSFAKRQGIKTVAEYVENEAIYEKVKALGVDYSQGYYFAKPQRLSH